jgi:hypothetical protein
MCSTSEYCRFFDNNAAHRWAAWRCSDAATAELECATQRVNCTRFTSCHLAELSRTYQKTALDGGDVPRTVGWVYRFERKRLICQCGEKIVSETRDVKQLRFYNRKKSGVSAGGWKPVACGTTAILTYKRRSWFGNEPIQVLLSSEKPGGRREWNQAKHEHCSTGDSHEATA